MSENSSKTVVHGDCITFTTVITSTYNGGDIEMGNKSQDIKDLIKEWMDEKPSRDLALLARKTSVPYTTLRRIYNEGGLPNCSTALSLFSVIGSKKQCFTYLEEYFPEAAAFTRREFTDDSLSLSPYSESIRPFIEDQISFIILAMSYGRLATPEVIKTLYGDLGVEKAGSMVESGKFVWKPITGLVPSDEGEFFFFENVQDIGRACEHILSLAKGKNGSQVALFGGVSEEESDKAKSIIRECCKAVKEIILNSKGGNSFVAMSMGFIGHEGLT